MKFIRFLALLALQAILALIAVDALLSDWGHFGRNPLQHLMTARILPAGSLSDNFVWRSLWALVLLLILLYWISSMAIWRRRPRAMQVRTSGGETILIHPGALLKFTRMQVESHPAVCSQKVRVRQKGNRGLSIWIWVNVTPIDSLPAIKRQIEASIRDGFAQVLGIEKIEEVTIIIGLDERNLTRRPGAKAAAEPRPEPPVRGSLAEGATYELERPREWAGEAPAETPGPQEPTEKP